MYALKYIYGHPKNEVTCWRLTVAPEKKLNVWQASTKHVKLLCIYKK